MTSGSLSSRDRGFLDQTATQIAMLDVEGAQMLATKLRNLAGAPKPLRSALVQAAAAASVVRFELVAQASPEYWLAQIDMGGTVPPSHKMNLVHEMVADRQALAARMVKAAALCQGVADRSPVPA